MGITLRKIKRTNSMSARKIMWIALVSFLVLSLLGALVFLIFGYTKNPASAFFESVSAFTTTGASVTGDVSSISTGMRIFRSAWQWIGGAASLMFFAFLFSESELWAPSANSVYHTGVRFRSAVKRILVIYVCLTVSEFILLAVFSYGFAESLCTAFSTISTGGFSSGKTPEGMPEVIIFLFMILTSISYPLYYYAVTGRGDKVSKNSELKALLWIIFGGCILISCSLLISGTYGVRNSIEYGFFQTVSSLSTTGFQIVDVSKWPSFAKTMLTILSFTGGSSLSAASGIKIIRLVLIIKILSRSFTVRIHPKAIVSAKLNGRQLPRATASAMSSFFLTYIVIYLLGVFVISLESTDFISCFELSSALINNVGTWSSGPISIASFSPVMQILMSFLMIAGRLELYAVLIPFSRNK